MNTTIISKNEYEKNIFLSRLLHLYDIPNSLYIKGSLPEVTIDSRGFLTPRILTVVGSRQHSSYATEAIDYLLSSLKGQSVIILSGLALGVDSLAHKSALKNGLKTIAFPGSGLDDKVLYPRENERLAHEILYNDGCLLSELSDETRAMKWTFLSRNRIMAALSDAVLVVEAKEKSGTLVTARHALELGRNIGVVPGSIFSDYLKGSHALLKDGASPITNPSDLFELLNLQGEYDTEETTNLPLLSKEEKILFDLLSTPLPKSELLEKSKLPPSTFLMTLTTLEMQGYVKVTLHEVRKIV